MFLTGHVIYANRLLMQVNSTPATALPLLEAGACGSSVVLAQSLLNREGALLDLDGAFGPGTKAAVRACQTRHKLDADGTIGAKTWAVLDGLAEPCPGVDTRAVTFIVRQEVGSKAAYEALYTRPAWPGGQSGITIGIGYDLRFAADMVGDWAPYLSGKDLGELGLWRGEAGSVVGAAALSGIVIPWNAAWSVFATRTLPATLRASRRAFPGLDGLPLLSAGALVSLVYNRGPATSGPGREEMGQIRDAVQGGTPEAVPALLRAMTRLWPDCPALRTRRQQEADLFAEGLQEGGQAHDGSSQT